MKKIKGPVVPIPAPFNENDGSLDVKTLRSYVSFLVDNGIKNIMSTVGTSRFNLLNKEEIFLFNETIVEACKGKAFAIVANAPYGWQQDAIDYAKHAERINADAYLLIHPDRNYGDEKVYKFYKNVSESVDVDIMIHEMPLRNGIGGGQVQYSLSLLEKLFTIPNIIGLKEEALDPVHSTKIVKEFSSYKSIVGAGGGMSRYLRDYWLGAETFLSGIGNFIPKIELDFFDNMQNENFKAAHELVYNVEIPYFNLTVPMGWHLTLKEALEMKGLFKSSNERMPLERISKENRNILKQAMIKNGWL